MFGVAERPARVLAVFVVARMNIAVAYRIRAGNPTIR
jgi:hypothetical protein